MPVKRHIAAGASSPADIEAQEQDVAKLKAAEPWKGGPFTAGFLKSFYRKPLPDLALIDRIREGLPDKVLNDAAGALGIDKQALIGHLRISNDVRLPQDRLSPADSDKVIRTLDLFDLACRVFKTEDQAREWFLQPAYGLAGRVPLDLLDTSQGAELVQDLLGAIEEGNYW